MVEIVFEELRIAVIGLGYVGLPLAIEFSKKFKVTGFDTNQKKLTCITKG
jgi:UDP-N-acetyl-D-galactosamine dehydrogenase